MDRGIVKLIIAHTLWNTEKNEISLCILMWKDFLRHHEKKADHRTMCIMRFIYLKMYISVSTHIHRCIVNLSNHSYFWKGKMGGVGKLDMCKKTCIFFFFFLALPHGLQDFSSPPQGLNLGPSSESAES